MSDDAPSSALTGAERLVICSALGLQLSSKPYRNHYAAPRMGNSRDICEDLAERGFMRRGGTEPNGTRFFFVTDAGAAAVGHALPTDDAS